MPPDLVIDRPGHKRAATVPFIELEDVHKVYHRGSIAVPVLKGVSLSIDRGEMVALMGASGSGKTTLINILGSLDRPSSGHYRHEGREVSGLDDVQRAWLRSHHVGFVFQNFNLLPRLTALENVMMPLAYAPRGLSAPQCRARAEELLTRVGLGERFDHEPSKLSGGEQQRVAIARSLVNRCTLLIADEPTGNLDSKTGEDLLELFRQLNREDGLTILLVTHDTSVAAHADRTIRMRDGLIFDDPGQEDGRSSDGRWSDPGSSDGRWAISGVSSSEPSTRGHPPSTRCRPRAGRIAALQARRGSLDHPDGLDGVAVAATQRPALGPDHLGHHHRRRFSLLAIAEIGTGAWTSIRALLTKTGVDNIVIQAGAASRGTA